MTVTNESTLDLCSMSATDRSGQKQARKRGQMNNANNIALCQNETGGGLATDATGLFESCRHALAKLDEDLVTAGQFAAKLKRRGFAVTAVELVDWHKRTFKREPEWHHAGRLPRSYGGGMKKTYFFAKDMEFTDADMADVVANRGLRCYFGVDWAKSGRRFIPRADFSRKARPGKNDVEISAEDFEAFKRFDGEKLERYETFSEFRTRMTRE